MTRKLTLSLLALWVLAVAVMSQVQRCTCFEDVAFVVCYWRKP